MHAYAMHAITVTLPDSLRLWFGSLFLNLSLSLSPMIVPLSNVGYAFPLRCIFVYVHNFRKVYTLFVDHRNMHANVATRWVYIAATHNPD